MKRPKISTGAIVIKDSNILLTKRSPTVEYFKDSWCLPGGHVEHGETVEQAIKREIKEELGIDFEPTEFVGYEDEVKQVSGHTVSLWFKGNIKGEFKSNHEVSEFKWVPIEEAKKMTLAFTHNNVLERFVK